MGQLPQSRAQLAVGDRPLVVETDDVEDFAVFLEDERLHEARCLLVNYALHLELEHHRHEPVLGRWGVVASLGACSRPTGVSGLLLGVGLSECVSSCSAHSALAPVVVGSGRVGGVVRGQRVVLLEGAVHDSCFESLHVAVG